MPYFNKNEEKVLFIHIPKTGGTSIEKYLSKKYDIPLDIHSLWDIHARFRNGVSYQHQTFLTIKKNSKLFKINFDENIKIFSAIRNPYDRLISDLFFYKLIDVNDTPQKVEKVIKVYLYGGNKYLRDNHVIPQHLFLIDETGEISKDIKILKTETLNEDMESIGFSNFNIRENATENRKNYKAYLNKNSVALINKYYEKDFKLLGYTMIF
jgi:hypothetical protein